MLQIQPEDPYEYLFAYRHLARQLSLRSPECGSTLLATPFSSRPVTQSCALLASSLASMSQKPILLVDLSEEDRSLANLLGLTSAMYCATDQRSRFFSESGKWYISTREGIPVGPYSSVDEAEVALADFVRAPNWVKTLKGRSWAPTKFVLPTHFQNLFFLPPAPARLALVRGVYLGDKDKNIAELLDHFYKQFGYVVFYGGSILNNSLMLSLIPHVNEVLHAVVESTTKVRDVDSAITTLQTYNARQVATILVRASKDANKVHLSAT